MSIFFLFSQIISAPFVVDLPWITHAQFWWSWLICIAITKNVPAFCWYIYLDDFLFISSLLDLRNFSMFFFHFSPNILCLSVSYHFRLFGVSLFVEVTLFNNSPVKSGLLSLVAIFSQIRGYETHTNTLARISHFLHGQLQQRFGGLFSDR